MEPLVADAIKNCPEPEIAIAVQDKLLVFALVHVCPYVLEYHMLPPETHAT
jgi:hypothetical protein